MYRYVVVTDEKSGPGFSLGGVEVKEVTNARDAATVLEECFGDKAVGLVAINDRFMDKLPQRILRKVERSSHPVVVPFPDPARERSAGIEDFLTGVIMRAIGYRVKLRT